MRKGNSWDDVSLGDVCQFKYGKSLPARDRTAGSFPVYGSNGQVDTHIASLSDGPTIVIGRKGSFGEVAYSETSCWPIDTTYYVDSSSTQADLKWLFYRLRSLGLTGLNRAAAVPGLNREDAYRKRFMLPSLEEQRHIAEVLDQAHALRGERQATIALLEELAESVFLDMFGAPSPSWPVLSVEDVAAKEKGSIRTGPFGSQLLHDEFVESGIAVLGIDNAVANEFRWGKSRFITPQKYKQLVRYTVKPGDVLITIMGTCGRCAIVPHDIPTAINTKHLCCITLDRKRCVPEYLHSYFLMHPHARSYLHKAAKGAIMSGLNMSIIKALPLHLPPIEAQQEFVEKLRGVQRLKASHASHLGELDDLFDSLQDRAFRGELWED